MELNLTGKRVLVTGSSRGIGYAVADAFLEEGARVAVTGRSPESLGLAERELSERWGSDHVLAVEADLTGSQATVDACIERVRERFGGMDILVANVGSGRGPGGLAATEADWVAMIRTNLIGATLVIGAAVPLMPQGGSIVLVSSIAGVESLPAPLPYSAAKAGLIALGANLARTLAEQGIRVNTVSPGNVLHPEGSWQAKLDSDPEAVQTYIDREVPLRRFGTPEEIARAVLFLASESAAGFITGANLVVDGGQTKAFG